MSKNIILDASALLALIQQEPGAEVIKPLLKNALISTVNLTEVLTVLQRINMTSEEAMDYISAMVKSILPFTLEQAQLAADLHIQTKSKGLSLGDRACLAAAILNHAPVYTADKIWSEINVDISIEVIR